MPAAVYNLRVEQGATYTKVFRILDEAGDPIDLTVYTARMQIRTEHAAATAVADLESPSEITLTADGYLTITIPASTTAAMTRHGVYDLELVLGSVVERALKGAVFLDPEVTRPLPP